jgi:hypothetical protein
MPVHDLTASGSTGSNTPLWTGSNDLSEVDSSVLAADQHHPGTTTTHETPANAGVRSRRRGRLARPATRRGSVGGTCALRPDGGTPASPLDAVPTGGAGPAAVTAGPTRGWPADVSPARVGGPDTHPPAPADIGTALGTPAGSTAHASSAGSQWRPQSRADRERRTPVGLHRRRDDRRRPTDHYP